MTISIIAAIGRNNEAGKNGGLLCHLPVDLRHFKEITSGHPVVMGRKTFESLPQGPLPNRRNMVVSRNTGLKIRGAEVYPSLDATFLKSMDENEVFIIGGGTIYEQTLPIANKLYLTKIHADFPEADVFFPQMNFSQWRETSRETFPADGKNPYPFSFLEYERL
ncbi:MAG: dihydrofolate reductase [Dysgonamonadaceae bacterium]|nr:dihydrofolate reductase [Dysgonamonadaceae bacterium]